jgi:hypothetical protein
MKLCKKCNTSKEFSAFSKKKANKDGLNNWCKECNKEYLRNYYLENKELYSNRSREYYELNSNTIKENSKNWRESNIEYTKEYHKKYYLENKEELLEYKKDHYLNNKDIYLDNSKKWKGENKEFYLKCLKQWRGENKEYSSDYSKKWFNDNPDKRKEYYENLRLNNPHIIAWRTVLKNAIKRINTKKINSTIEMLGYSSNDLKIHLESLFKDGMSWENWGDWHVDHKIPVSKFDKETPMSIVNSLDNLQPLWALDNLSKSNKIEND